MVDENGGLASEIPTNAVVDIDDVFVLEGLRETSSGSAFWVSDCSVILQLYSSLQPIF